MLRKVSFETLLNAVHQQLRSLRKEKEVSDDQTKLKMNPLSDDQFTIASNDTFVTALEDFRDLAFDELHRPSHIPSISGLAMLRINSDNWKRVAFSQDSDNFIIRSPIDRKLNFALELNQYTIEPLVDYNGWILKKSDCSFTFIVSSYNLFKACMESFNGESPEFPRWYDEYISPKLIELGTGYINGSKEKCDFIVAGGFIFFSKTNKSTPMCMSGEMNRNFKTCDGCIHLLALDSLRYGRKKGRYAIEFVRNGMNPLLVMFDENVQMRQFSSLKEHSLFSTRIRFNENRTEYVVVLIGDSLVFFKQSGLVLHRVGLFALHPSTCILPETDCSFAIWTPMKPNAYRKQGGFAGKFHLFNCFHSLELIFMLKRAVHSLRSRHSLL